MAKQKQVSNKANKAKQFHCLKIVESFINGDKKTANKHIKKLVENKISQKIDHILNTDNLI